MCKEGLGLRRKLSAIDPAGFVSGRQIPQGHLRLYRAGPSDRLLGADFRPSRLHPRTIVILIPVVNRVVQQKLFRAVLDELAAIGEPVNRVLEVDLDGEEVTFTLYDWPATTSPSSGA